VVHGSRGKNRKGGSEEAVFRTQINEVVRLPEEKCAPVAGNVGVIAGGQGSHRGGKGAKVKKFPTVHEERPTGKKGRN